MKQLKTTYLVMRKRLQSWPLLFLLVASIGTSIGLQLSAPQTAMAASGVFASGPLTENIKAYALRNAIASCLYRSSTNPTEQNIASGKWFTSSRSVGVTHLYASDDGTRECKTAGLVQDATSAGGWASNIEAACAAGFARLNGSSCISGTGDFTGLHTSSANYQRNFDTKRGGLAFTDAMYYLLYARSMEIGCKATPVIAVDEATPDQKAMANTDKSWSMKVVGAGGTVTNTIYKAELGRGRKISTTETPNSHSTQELSCIDLVKKANQYADAYSKYLAAHPNEAGTATTGDEAADNEDASKTSCKIDGIGWLICPVVRFIGKVVDGSYVAVATLLKTPAVNTDTSQGMYLAWSLMRNIANVAFVIAFLVIIYSQITSIGLSNYGIKKMLPRLIVAAILVNVSYWLCAIAVDLSNISGYALKDLLDGVSRSLFEEGGAAQSGGGGKWDILTDTVIAGVGAVALLYVELSVFIPLAVAALITIIIVVILLIARQAFIVMLIVISPLAFVAFLLPNTASLFTKWRKLFTTLLMLFPIIAFIFGGSALAGTIITKSAEGMEEPAKFLMQLVGAGVTIVPLIAVPVFLKGTSALFGKFGGMVNNPNRGVFDRSRKFAQGLRDQAHVNNQIRSLRGGGMPLKGKVRGFVSDRKDIAAGRARQLEDLQKERTARMATTADGRPSDFARKVAGDKADIYAGRQSQYLLELDEEKVRNSLSQMKIGIEDPSEAISIYQQKFEEAVAAGDTTTARAAQRGLMESGKRGRAALRESIEGRSGSAIPGGVDAASETGMELRKDLQGSDMKKNAADVYKWAVAGTRKVTDSTGRTRTEGISLSDIARDATTWSDLSAEQIQGQVEASLNEAKGTGGVSKDTAQRALESRGNESIGGKERAILESMK